MRERPHRCAALALLAALGVGCGDDDGEAVRQVPADGGFDDRATQGMVDAPAPAPGAITPNLGRFVPLDDPSLRALLLTSSGRSPEYPGAIARDLDGDGESEILSFSDLGWALLTRTGGAWRVAQRGPEPVRTAGFCDLDGDGAAEIAMARRRPTLLHNDGALRFSNITASALGAQNVEGEYFGVTCADLDWDGLLDVAFAQMNCGTGPNRVYRQEGDLRFVEVAETLGVAIPQGASFSLAVDRMVDDDTLFAWNFTEGCVTFGNHRWHFRGDDDLPRLLRHDETNAPSATPMGSAILDIDLDGRLDLFLTSGGDNIAFGAPDYGTTMRDLLGLGEHPPRIVNPTSGWAAVLLDADLDGRPDVYTTHSPARPDQPPDRIGDGLYVRSNNGRFLETAEALGLGGDNDCQPAFGVDLDRDGDTDLLTGCTRGLRVLRNDLVPAGNGRTVQLRGTVSNPDGVHALLRGPEGEMRALRGGGQPFATGVQWESLRAPSGAIRVLWPSGIEQRVEVTSSPVLVVTEPAVLRVSPRRVTAGMSTPVRVEVDPAALGTPDATVSVTATQGQWSTALTRGEDGRWRGELLPPMTRSTTALTVRVGELTLRVRPKIFVR
jgi:FG-GAP-like repeat